ncbi:MAG TPA: hypothetical protein VEO54_11785 [Thermoanaerobaculia bacterium]|nr:hypothetical protein [Thermoanaerobaculia bacterium]
MQQHFFSRAALAAVVILTISAPAVRAEDEVAPSGSLEARMGRPPGATDTIEPRLDPGLPSDDEFTGYAMREEARMGRQAKKQPSFWEELMGWLQEQALRARD